MWRHQCKLDDSGPALDALDRRPSQPPAAAAIGLWNAEQGAAELRRLSHKLRPLQPEPGVNDLGLSPGGRASLLPATRTMEPLAAAEAPPWDSAPAGQVAWGVTLLLAAGLAMLLAGVGSLAWSIRLTDARAAHWGITAGLAGVGLLTVAIARLTARLWRNSRRLTAQLDGVSEQLESMRGIAATSALVRGAERYA